LAKGFKDPKEVDDFAFERGFSDKKSENVDLGPRLSNSD